MNRYPISSNFNSAEAALPIKRPYSLRSLQNEDEAEELERLFQSQNEIQNLEESLTEIGPSQKRLKKSNQVYGNKNFDLQHLASQQIMQNMVVHQQRDTSGLFRQFLPRLRGAQIEGFESVKKLNMKVNSKRAELGLNPIDLESQYPLDLQNRMRDQEELFNQLLRLPLDESLRIQRHQFETRQIRISNIKTAQFIVPSKDVIIEQVNLYESLPFLHQSQSHKREYFLQQMKEKVITQIEIYFEELQSCPQVPTLIEVESNSEPINTNRDKLKQISNQALKDYQDVNAETIDYQNLEALLYITQSTISELKNSKSKKLDNVKNMATNPYDLQNRLRAMLVTSQSYYDGR